MKKKKHIQKTCWIFLSCFLFLKGSSRPIFWSQNNQIQKEKISVPPVQSPTKKEISTVVGVLSIVGTNWQIPIVQGEDNQFYLNHDQYHQSNALGTPFLDYRNKIEDSKLLIYGHNSQTVDVPFHFLENYTQPQFYKRHSYMSFKTSQEELYQVISIIITTDSKAHMKLQFTAEEWSWHLDWIESSSIYKTNVIPNKTAQLLILQTCYYQPPNSYLLVVAQKVT